MRPDRMSDAELHASALAHHAELQRRMANRDDDEDDEPTDNASGDLLEIPSLLDMIRNEQRDQDHGFDGPPGSRQGSALPSQQYGSIPRLLDADETEQEAEERETEMMRRLGLTGEPNDGRSKGALTRQPSSHFVGANNRSSDPDLLHIPTIDYAELAQLPHR